MNPTFEEMYQECVQHYIDKVYSPEHSVAYIAPAAEERILYFYKCIQEEKLSQAIDSNNI